MPYMDRHGRVLFVCYNLFLTDCGIHVSCRDCRRPRVFISGFLEKTPSSFKHESDPFGTDMGCFFSLFSYFPLFHSFEKSVLFFFSEQISAPQKRVKTELRSPTFHETPEAQLCRILLETAAPGSHPWARADPVVEGFLRLALPETSSNHICL